MCGNQKLRATLKPCSHGKILSHATVRVQVAFADTKILSEADTGYQLSRTKAEAHNQHIFENSLELVPPAGRIFHELVQAFA